MHPALYNTTQVDAHEAVRMGACARCLAVRAPSRPPGLPVCHESVEHVELRLDLAAGGEAPLEQRLQLSERDENATADPDRQHVTAAARRQLPT
jgi:hypothetical protein